MIGILAQTDDMQPDLSWLERFPTDEIVTMVVVMTVFATILLIVITLCVTRTIRTCHVASANARMVEKLSAQGLPADQIERLVRANWRKGGLPVFHFPSLAGGWREPGKPGMHSTGQRPVGKSV
jgi:hypothetical protein